MVKIIQSIIPDGRKNRPGYQMVPKYITVHNTANTNKGANAELHARYVKNPTTDESWHITVDDSDTAYQHLPFNECGWHAGDGENGTGNRSSIGIEICENSDGDFEKAVKNAQEIIKSLMSQFNIPISNVVPHKHWSGKNCPRKLLDRWDEFIKGITGVNLETDVKGITQTNPVANNTNSIVDYLKSIGVDSSFANRAKLAKEYGINNYNGTASQNIQLLNAMRNGGKPKQSAPAPESKQTSKSGKYGNLQIVNVKSAAIVMDRPDRLNSKNIGTVAKGVIVPLNGSVRGANSDTGYWEIEFNNRLGYVTGKYGKRV